MLGGGRGTAAVAHGLQATAASVVAVVGTADDGGSSGVLRRSLHVMVCGELRRSLIALSRSDPEVCDLLEFLISPRRALRRTLPREDHPAAAELNRDRMTAVDVVGRLLRIDGQVLPVTLQDVELVLAEDDGTEVRGEARIAARPFTSERPQVRLEPSTGQPPRSNCRLSRRSNRAR